jgi:hypothetical protein
MPSPKRVFKKNCVYDKLYRVSEKLLDIKTARFYGKLFLGHPKGVQKIAYMIWD